MSGGVKEASSVDVQAPGVDERRGLPLERRGLQVERRGVLGAMAGAAAGLGALGAPVPAARASLVKSYEPAQLLGADGTPLRAADLAVGSCHVFNYPYVSTPSFLINLGAAATTPESLATEDGQPYVWPGGSGPANSLVAFCAICSHKLSHPARTISFINYRHEPVRFRSADRNDVVGEQLIYCCSDKSVFDPRRGARVLGGPAKQPLATILIEHRSEDDTLVALGTYGGDKFDAFFEKFGHRVALEWGLSDVRALSGDSVTALPIERFSKRQMRCGTV